MRRRKRSDCAGCFGYKISFGRKIPSANMRKSFWFWAWIVLGTVRKDSRRKPKARCEAWENLVIIRASNPKEALRKAEQIGKESAGDCDGTLRLFGKPAWQHFLGVRSIGVIHEKLQDGAEITWNLKQTTFSKAKKSIRPKVQLLRELSKEFSHVVMT
jgi:hypothetical protein